MATPTLTIVTPVKNGVRYMQACLDSVAAARAGGLSIEHIVVDAASTDGTLDVLSRSPETIVLIEPKLDSIAAMTHGRDRATGDYVVLLMADDLLAPDFAAVASALLAAQPDCALALFACELFEDGGPSRIVSAPRRIWTVLNKYPGVNSAVIRRDLFLSIEMPVSYCYVNDRAMMLRLWAAADSVTVSDRVLVRMRLHPQSATGSNTNAGKVGRDFMTLANDLVRDEPKGPAADIFAAYAWRRATRVGGALPRLASLARVPKGWMRLAAREDELREADNARDSGAVRLDKPFAFTAGPANEALDT